MQGRKVDQLAQSPLDRGVDPDRVLKALASVDDAVPDRIRFGHLGESPRQLVAVKLTPLSRQSGRCEQLVVSPEDSKLDAARPRVDRQYVQASSRNRLVGVGRRWCRWVRW